MTSRVSADTHGRCVKCKVSNDALLASIAAFAWRLAAFAAILGL